MKRNSTRNIAATGVLFALAIVLSFVESVIAPLVGLSPWIKPGLANVVVMYTLVCLSRRQALFLAVLKGGFNLLTRGVVAGLISLSGSLVSLAVMLLLLLPRHKPSVVLLSIAGALGHNAGQFAMARVLIGASYWVYIPSLLISGVLMGCLTASLLRVLLPALQKSGLAGKEQQRNAKDEPDDSDVHEE